MPNGAAGLLANRGRCVRACSYSAGVVEKSQAMAPRMRQLPITSWLSTQGPPQSASQIQMAPIMARLHCGHVQYQR